MYEIVYYEIRPVHLEHIYFSSVFLRNIRKYIKLWTLRKVRSAHLHFDEN